LSIPTTNETRAERDFIATPAPSNPLGVKGASESGAVGAPAAMGNAVIDALWHLGVRDITLPIRPEKVWRVLRSAKSARSLQQRHCRWALARRKWQRRLRMSSRTAA
jgi:hypothetical protein